jgi:hypothetical protein
MTVPGTPPRLLLPSVLQERYNALAEAVARDPTGLEAGDRQQMERLAATLHRWLPAWWCLLRGSSARSTTEQLCCFTCTMQNTSTLTATLLHRTMVA